jgi:hypothetical protein
MSVTLDSLFRITAGWGLWLKLTFDPEPATERARLRRLLPLDYLNDPRRQGRLGMFSMRTDLAWQVPETGELDPPPGFKGLLPLRCGGLTILARQIFGAGTSTPRQPARRPRAPAAVRQSRPSPSGGDDGSFGGDDGKDEPAALSIVPSSRIHGGDALSDGGASLPDENVDRSSVTASPPNDKADGTIVRDAPPEGKADGMNEPASPTDERDDEKDVRFDRPLSGDDGKDGGVDGKDERDAPPDEPAEVTNEPAEGRDDQRRTDECPRHGNGRHRGRHGRRIGCCASQLLASRASPS